MRCRGCDEIKPYHDFYKSSGFTCKECIKSAVKKRRREDDHYREYDRLRSTTLDRKVRAAKLTSKWRKKYPEAYRAQNAVNNAIRDGKIEKEPCLFCGDDKVHGHHSDYSKPLDVVWLCAKCHHRLHARFPKAIGHE